jgi:hypothetical protein
LLVFVKLCSKGRAAVLALAVAAVCVTTCVQPADAGPDHVPAPKAVNIAAAGAADEQIDFLPEIENNILGTVYQGLIAMKPVPVDMKSKVVKQQVEVKEAKLRQENSKRAKEAADELFPGEKWQQVEDEIYLSPRRPVGKNSNFKDELKDAQTLKKFGSTVYLVPESSRQTGKKYDAIVNGLKFEFKDVGGNANTLETHFLRSRSQAPNVFINLETANLTKREVMGALYSARNSVTRVGPNGRIIKGYGNSNKFKGGRIIIKLKGQERLIYLNVNDLAAK